LFVKEMNSGRIIVLVSLFFITTAIFVFAQEKRTDDNRFISYTVDPQKLNVKLYWKDDSNHNFGSIKNLKLWLEKSEKNLVFAMNGGMYKTDGSPLGLFIQEHQTKSPLNTSNGNGNFYLKPNGIFYLTTDNIPWISGTTDFVNNGKIKYATQSGPMLVINGQIHSAFKKGSANLNIRNGVGILPGNKIVFAMSKNEISLYDFADYFKTMGCKNALYLDGFVSRAYLPEKGWIQVDGNFGVIIGITKS
jgi:uncharacterized protein YigE (DUF2233 family)